MFNGLITVCDFCGDVLRGKQGTAEVHKRFMELSGSPDVCIKDFDQQTREDTFIYVTDKIRKERMHFCLHSDKNCFTDWCNLKEQMFKDRKTKRLTEEAANSLSDPDNYWKS